MVQIDMRNSSILKMLSAKTILVLVVVLVGAIADDGCTISEFSGYEDIAKKCNDIVISNLNVPANTTLKLNLRNDSTLVFEGRTSFDYFEWKGPLIQISGNNLTIEGAEGSVLDGQGELYWDGLGGNGGVTKPKFIRLEVFDSKIKNINIKNCPVHCVSVASNYTLFSDWTIDVSEGNKGNFTGHNTDGFDVSGNYLTFENSVVRNQDDCLVVNVGSNILVSNMSCYGGHGLSISVGFDDFNFEKNSVSNVIFENSLVNWSPNGIHIKTHADSGPGIIENVIYRNIRIENITNYALNIQQDYVNGQSTGIPGTNIPIVNLLLENITGYMESYNGSPTVEALFLCGDGACSNWVFRDIDIVGAVNDSICTFEPAGYSC